MAGKLYMADKTFPFDEDIFFADYQDEPDLVKNVLVTSGIMVDDPLIKSKVNAGNQFTIPFYNALDEADEQNYDGVPSAPAPRPDTSTAAPTAGMPTTSRRTSPPPTPWPPSQPVPRSGARPSATSASLESPRPFSAPRA